jgi:LmbE family N-acetylglucosaminyl deacetylase
VHNISRYWASGEIRKQSFFDGAVRALVLSPHPDDESIGCGGTIGLMKAAGATVDVLFMTSGEAGHPEPPKAELAKALLEQRKKEAASACGVLGVDNIFFLGGRDGE